MCSFRSILAAKPSVAGLASRALEEVPRQGLGAIVMGADYRGLGVVRSLGRRGVPVWVLTAGGQLLAATSRYARRRLRWPAGDDRKRIDFLLELAAKHNLKGWALFATDDYSVALLAHHHDLLAARFRLAVPPWNVLGWVCDKRLMHQLADRVAVDQPWTRCPRNREDMAQIACPFPVILKPAMRLELNRFTAAKAWRVTDRQSLLARYDEACTLVAPDLILLQEVIPGGGESQFSFAALCQDGYPLAWVVARRARQIPAEFGRFSTYVETVDEGGVVEPAARMLSAIGFTGLVEVEFKRDARDGRYKLLDINPRVWGWHTLCSRAGVDFPYLLWRLMQGEPVSEVRGRAGVRWVRMSTDLPAAILEVLRGRLTLGAYVRSLGGPLESAVFASDDPLPGLLELPLLAYLLGKRFLRVKEPVLRLFGTHEPQLNGRSRI